MSSFSKVSTGLSGLDEIINALRMGDNVVWQVDSIADYRRFVVPFVREALARKRKVIYMRFANHDSLLEEGQATVTHHLTANAGFESFSSQVHGIITSEGRDAFYVFDSLSDLLMAWATDLMIGNFFFITCPYLFELNTVAYFALLRGRHSFKTIARIRETTQVLLDVYNNEGRICIHPLKVWQRYSPACSSPTSRKGTGSPPSSTASRRRPSFPAWPPGEKVGRNGNWISGIVFSCRQRTSWADRMPPRNAGPWWNS